MLLKRLRERWNESGRIIKEHKDYVARMWQIMTTRNFQWDNYNDLINYIDENIAVILEFESMHWLLCRKYSDELSSALSECPFLMSEYTADRKAKKKLDEHFEMSARRVSFQSYKKHATLQILDDLLNISSADEFNNRHYKIWNIEINSFEDLQHHRKELEDLRNKTQNYEIPLLDEVSKWADEKWITVPYINGL